MLLHLHFPQNQVQVQYSMPDDSRPIDVIVRPVGRCTASMLQEQVGTLCAVQQLYATGGSSTCDQPSPPKFGESAWHNGLPVPSHISTCMKTSGCQHGMTDRQSSWEDPAAQLLRQLS